MLLLLQWPKVLCSLYVFMTYLFCLRLLHLVAKSCIQGRSVKDSRIVGLQGYIESRYRVAGGSSIY